MPLRGIMRPTWSTEVTGESVEDAKRASAMSWKRAMFVVSGAQNTRSGGTPSSTNRPTAALLTPTQAAAARTMTARPPRCAAPRLRSECEVPSLWMMSGVRDKRPWMAA